MVDDEYYELVMTKKWQVKRVRNSYRKYAITTIVVNGKQTSTTMHRFILNHYAELFDHWDGNGLNNQKANLRKASRVENARNQKVRKHSSKFKGVSKHSDGRGWVSHIRVNKKLIGLGYFKCETDAALAYDNAALLHFGEFSRTNKQMGVL